MDETALNVATQYVTEAEQRRAQQISLIAKLLGEEQAQARQVLTEIERTLAIARTHQALLLSFADEP
ncbi:hypothetical protein [Methylobacterium soli]|uniref:Uncharacterized protein n=1 Tax=Methylobacterium soli TaxID=553447 RepID=A0A6L3SX48_9HYPH|nr:hypothetical protein [Methylobacterium soli]KAB1077165.1 hypothetical protein F6X53_19990 [Methylobacterium soli]GJE43581.1 hypothetical protein AEGHOMDF_2760 [Methylobacterium soli]